MKFGGTGKDARRFIRSVGDAFEAVKDHHKNGVYQMGFALVFPNGLSGLTDSEVLSYLEKISGAVNKFSESEVMSIELDITQYTDHTDVNTLILEQTKARYEASKALEESVKEGKDVAAKAEIKKIQESPKAAVSKSEAKRLAIQRAQG